MNMKCKLLAAAAAGALVVGSVSYADGMSDVRPYVGGELSFNMPKYPAGSDYKKNKPGLGAFVGARICDYFGVEAGYDYVMKAKSKSDSSDSIKISNLYLDGMGYFAASPEVDLIGAVGIGRIKPKAKDNGGTYYNKAKSGYRLGLGAQYKFDENIAARLMVRYQKGKKEALKSMTSVALGVAYTF